MLNEGQDCRRGSAWKLGEVSRTANCLPNIVFWTDLNGQLRVCEWRADWNFRLFPGGSLKKIEYPAVPRTKKIVKKAKKKHSAVVSRGSMFLLNIHSSGKTGLLFLTYNCNRLVFPEQNDRAQRAGNNIWAKESWRVFERSDEKIRTISDNHLTWFHKQTRQSGYTTRNAKTLWLYEKGVLFSTDFLSLYAPEYIEEVKSFLR